MKKDLSTFIRHEPMEICIWHERRGVGWLTCRLTSQTRKVGKKRDVTGDHKSLRLHLNARDFSTQKQNVRWMFGGIAAPVWSSNIRFLPARTVKLHWRINTLTLSNVEMPWFTFTPYGGSSNVTSMYLSPLLAGSRARSCQKRKPKQYKLILTYSAQGTLSSLKMHTCWKKRGKIIIYLHKDLNRAFSNVQIRRTQIRALIHRGGRV